jgi:WD40 repeat protein/serine/threonine protein kinase
VKNDILADAETLDERLAEQVAELAERVARGETLDLGRLEKECPLEAQKLHRLLPAIRLLSELADEEATEDHGPWFARPPDVLGDFRLGREIGRGGIGVVYEATQISLGRRVAVKVLPPSSLLDPRQLRRFEIEAQAAAALQHPNIVPVFAYGTERGVPFFAMRLIEGRNLAEVVNGLIQGNASGLSPREVAELGRQAAEALDYAHRHEVLHRDIKPSNFLVDSQSRLWIADFGLARVRGDSDLTASGDVLGTLRYLSPEQAKGSRAAIDGRSDVYGLGATLYELLTLRQVFEGVDRAELLIKILSDEARFSRALDGAIPIDLKTIVLKALAKDPCERYATAGHLAADLTLFLADQPILTRPKSIFQRITKQTRRHWRAIATAGLLTGLVMFFSIAATLRSNSTLRAINQRLQVEKDRADRHALMADRHALGAQLRLAAQAIDNGQRERAQEILRDIPLNTGAEASTSFAWRYLWREARREIVVLAGPAPRFAGMALAPDGKLLATSIDSSGLQVRDAVTGSGIRDMEKVSGQIETPTFSWDGSLLAAAHRTADPGSPDGFSIWNVASGRHLVRLPMGRDHPNLFCHFLRSGRFLGSDGILETRIWTLADRTAAPLLVDDSDRPSALDSAAASGELLTLETAHILYLHEPYAGKSTRPLKIEAPRENISIFECSKNSVTVAAVSATGNKLTLWDGQTGNLRATYAIPPDVYRLGLSPDGATVALVDKTESVHILDGKTGMTRRVGFPSAVHPRPTGIAFSADSGRLATVVFGIANGNDPDPVSIWDVATLRRLATFPGRPEELGPLAFTPDSRALLISSKTGVRRWHWMPADDDAQRRPAGHQDEAWSLAFSPDGGTVVTGSDDSKPDPTIKVWNNTSGRLTRAWNGGHGTVAALAWSPDGQVIASGHLIGQANVRLWDATSGTALGTLKGHTDRVRAVIFSRDGKTLATAGADGTVRLWDVASRRERFTLSGHADTVHSIAYSPDGKRLASAGNDGDVRLWDLPADGEPVSSPQILRNRANLMAVAFAPDGKTIAAADDMGSVTIWDLERATPLRLIHSDGEKLFQLAFTGDGAVLAAAGKQGSIGFWDPMTGQELMTLAAHRGQINGLAFSPDSSILGSVAHDGSVRLWRAAP